MFQSIKRKEVDNVVIAGALPINFKLLIDEYSNDHQQMVVLAEEIKKAVQADDAPVLNARMQDFRAIYPRLLWDALNLYGEAQGMLPSEDPNVELTRKLGGEIANTALSLTESLRECRQFGSGVFH